MSDDYSKAVIGDGDKMSKELAEIVRLTALADFKDSKNEPIYYSGKD